jgi:hypothetical protein
MRVFLDRLLAGGGVAMDMRDIFGQRVLGADIGDADI